VETRPSFEDDGAKVNAAAATLTALIGAGEVTAM
jgi:hypothetical protein